MGLWLRLRLGVRLRRESGVVIRRCRIRRRRVPDWSCIRRGLFGACLGDKVAPARAAVESEPEEQKGQRNIDPVQTLALTVGVGGGV